MTETSYFWGGTATGDASLAPYDDDEYSDFWSLIFNSNRDIQGVIPTSRTPYDNKLEVTNPAGATARVNEGAALVDGKLYKSDAVVDFTVSGNAVWWVIGLRKSWSAQTVRAFSRGTYAAESLALASLIQNDGTTWEIPLATIQTDGSGNVDTINDQRAYIHSAGTKRIIVPVIHAYNQTDAVEIESGVNIAKSFPDNKLCRARGYFLIPADYISDMTVKAIVTPAIGASGDVYSDIQYTGGQCGELITSIGDFTGFQAITVASDIVVQTLNCIQQLSLNDISVGDIITFTWIRDGVHGSDTLGDSCSIWGFQIEYEGAF